MTYRTRHLAAACLLLGLPLVAGCDDQPTAERTGQEIGRALDRTGERIGEAADDAAAGAGRAMQDAGRAIENKAEEMQERDTRPASE